MASISENLVILIGNIGTQPEFKQHSADFHTAGFTLATDEVWRDKAGQQKSRTDWHRVEVRGRLAEIVRDIMGKGEQVYVKGKLRTDRVEREGGGADFYTKVVAEEVLLLGRRDRRAVADAGADAGDQGQGAAANDGHVDQSTGQAATQADGGQQRSAGGAGSPAAGGAGQGSAPTGRAPAAPSSGKPWQRRGR